MENKEKPPKGKSTIIEKFIAFILAVIIVTMFTQVVFRYLLNQSLYWSEEIVRYLFVWLVFFGGALVVRDNGHIGIDFLLSIMPARYRKYFQLAGSIIVVVVSIFFIAAGLVLVFKLRGSHSPALGLPINWFLYGALPLASFFSAWYGYVNFKKIRKTGD